jgi:hypothetical protein
MSGTNYGYPPIVNESVSAVTATPSMAIGTRRFEQGDELVYLYNNGTTQISPGNGCILSGTTGYSVTVSSVTSVDTYLAVCKHATATTGTYFWGVYRGFVPMRAVANSGLASADYVMAGDNGTFTVPGTVVTGYIGNFVGKVTQSTASAGLAFGYVNCM